jgi:hypothetical protein
MPLRIRIPALALLLAANNIRYGTLTPNRFYYNTNLVGKIYLGNNLIFG